MVVFVCVFPAGFRRVPVGHAVPGRVYKRRDANTRTRPALRGRVVVRPRADGRRRAGRLLQRGGHGDAHAPRTGQRAVHNGAVRVRSAVQVPEQPTGIGETGHGGRAQRARRAGARHALQPQLLRVLPRQEVFAAVAQLPGHVPAERDVPVHGPAEGGAQVQARHGVGDAGPGELGADGAARQQVVVGRQAGAADGRRQSPGQRDGHHTRERHVQRERGQAGVPRRAVRGRSGAVAVLRRAGAAPGGGQRSRHAGGVQVVGAQLAGHVLVAAARVPVEELRAGRAHSVCRLGLAGLRQRVGVRVHRQRVGHAQVAARSVGQPPARGSAEQHVHVPVPGPARRPRVDVL